MSFSPLPYYLVPLRLKYSPHHPILKHPQRTFLSQCQPPSSPPCKATGKIIACEIIQFFTLVFGTVRSVLKNLLQTKLLKTATVGKKVMQW